MTELPEIFLARDSAFVKVEPEPAWRPLLRFTIVTAVCIAIFLVLFALGIGWLQSLDFGGCVSSGGLSRETYPDAYLADPDSDCLYPSSS
ncbi:hypothetical protein [Mycetocola sp. 2940]|uniref:hypothetical protein n=1 Tax=Mycetocola sp. 2940 TaxID=3156452 RepID=UPI00339879D3